MAAVTETQPSTTPTPWYDRASDWFNAILVKESRQALKSKVFVATFMMLLAVAWVVSVFGLLNSGSALEFGSVGSDFFVVFFLVLSFAAVVLVPFSTFRSLLSERDQNTFDLLSITALKPRQIVWGKLLSSGLQLFLFYSVITPFIAFASLLQGFNAATAVVALAGTLLLSLLLSMAALMIATFAKVRVLQGLLTASTLIGVFLTYTWVVIPFALFALPSNIIAVADPRFWLVLGLVVAAAISYFFLFQQIAVSQLTFESDNRSTGVRVMIVAQFWMVWLGYAVYFELTSTPPSRTIVAVVAGFCVLHCAIPGFAFSTEGDYLSRRVRRDVPENRLLRLLKAPFLPGGARGYLLSLKHLAALWIITVICHSSGALRPASLSSAEFFSGLADLRSPAWSPTLRLITAMCLYAAIYLGIAAALARWGTSVSTEVRPAHVRVLTILLFLAGTIFPLVLRVTDVIDRPEFTVFDITSPKVTCTYLLRQSSEAAVAFDWSSPFESLQLLTRQRGYFEVVLVLLAFAAGVVVLINLPAMYRGATDLEPLRPRRPEDVEPVEAGNDSQEKSANFVVPAAEPGASNST